MPARHSSSNSQLAASRAEPASRALAQPTAAAGALGGSNSPRRRAPSGALAPYKGAEAAGPPAATSPNLRSELSGAKEFGLEEETGDISKMRALTNLQTPWTFVLVYTLAPACSP